MVMVGSTARFRQYHWTKPGTWPGRGSLPPFFVHFLHIQRITVLHIFMARYSTRRVVQNPLYILTSNDSDQVTRCARFVSRWVVSNASNDSVCVEKSVAGGLGTVKSVKAKR